MTLSTRVIRGLGEIASAYDAFILDLWGCLHDGVAVYPAALDCLHRLKAAGKTAIILSNAPRRAREAEARLNEMGVGRDLYAALYCSGEETWRAITGNAIPALRGRGNKAFAIMARRDRAMTWDGSASRGYLPNGALRKAPRRPMPWQSDMSNRKAAERSNLARAFASGSATVRKRAPFTPCTVKPTSAPSWLSPIQ